MDEFENKGRWGPTSNLSVTEKIGLAALRGKHPFTCSVHIFHIHIFHSRVEP